MAKAPKGKAWGFHRRWPYLAIRNGPPPPSHTVSPATAELVVGNQLIGGLNIYNGKPFYPHVREPPPGSVSVVGQQAARSITQPGGGLPSYSATHYVSESGTGTWAQATNPLTPASLATAMSSAVQGNVVEVGPGQYVGTATGKRFVPAFVPSNSGIAGSPIIFYAKNRAGLTYEAGVTTSLSHDGGTGPVLGTSSNNYITFDGFFFDETLSPYAQDTGQMTIATSDNVSVLSCVFLSLQPSGIGTDNHSCIRVEGCDNTIIRDNYFTGCGADSTPHNGPAVLIYSSGYGECSYNTSVGCNALVRLKSILVGIDIGHRMDGWSIHHNWVDGTGAPQATQAAIMVQQSPGASPVIDVATIYQNVIINCQSAGIGFLGASNFTDGLRICNNTIYNCTYGFQTWNPTFNFSDSNIQNNIFSGLTTAMIRNLDNDAGSGSSTAVHANYGFAFNDYHNYSSWISDDLGSLNGESFATMSGSGDLNNEDPDFNSVGTEDFTLNTGTSPCAGTGEDILNLLGGGTGASINMGAYILADQSDQIGRRT